MSEFLLGIGAYLLESFKLFCVMHFVLRFDFHVKKCFIFGTLLAVLAGVLGWNGFLTQSAVLCLVLAVFCFCGKGKVLYSFFSYCTISLFDSLCTSVILWALDVNYVVLGEEAGFLFVLNMVSLIFLPLLIGISYFWQKQNGYVGKSGLSRRWIWFVLAGELALSFFVEAFQVVATEDSRLGKGMAVGLCIGSIIVVLVGVFFLLSVTTNEHYKEVTRIKEQLLEAQMKHYEALLEKEMETKVFRHDIRNHFYCMRALLKEKDYQGVEQYFDKIGTYLEALEPSVQTGSEMLNIILSGIIGKYPKVAYKVDGIFSPRLSMDNHDVCTIFYNLLENAFAAANETEEKMVELTFGEAEQILFCKIENSTSHKVKIKDNSVKTEKKDTEYHGFGTINAKRCVEKNGGELHFTCDEKRFLAEMVFFCEE